MKDGRTHLTYKAEHAVDMDSGAIVAVTVQPADRGDTTSIKAMVEETFETLLDVREQGSEVQLPQDAVADKSYHSNEACVELWSMDVRPYVSEPNCGRRAWTHEKTGQVRMTQCDAVYANRRRIRGGRGKRLLRGRGELVERSFAHCYEKGAMRRTHLRGRPNILKRLLIHVAAFSQEMVLRAVNGLGGGPDIALLTLS
jgi:transposase